MQKALGRLSKLPPGGEPERKLLAAGVLLSVPPPVTEGFRREFRELTRLTILGEPVSQTIIEDRRARG